MYSPRAITSESQFNPGRPELKCPHKKEHCPDTSRKRDEIVKSVYDRQPSRLEGTLSEVVCQEGSSSISAVETPTIIDLNHESVLQRVTSFVIALADILLRSAMQGD